MTPGEKHLVDQLQNNLQRLTDRVTELEVRLNAHVDVVNELEGRYDADILNKESNTNGN
jgi:chaperonin cofactor prefoldin